MRCFVPNCANTIGVLFPQDYENQNVWLKSLKISDLIPDVDSFVCFDHFDENDLEEVVGEDGALEKRIRPDAVPKLLSLEDVIEKETEEFLDFKNQKTSVPQSSLELSDDSPKDNGRVNIEQTVEESTKEEPDQSVINDEDSQFVPQFQPDFILEQQEYSEPENFSTSFSDADSVPNQEQDNSQESSLVIQENQDFLTVQHEFAAQQDYTSDGQVFTSEGQPVQIFTSEGQTVFATDDQQVFVSEGQTLLTQDGQRVFISQGNLDNVSGDAHNFVIDEKISDDVTVPQNDVENLEGDNMDDVEMQEQQLLVQNQEQENQKIIKMKSAEEKQDESPEENRETQLEKDDSISKEETEQSLEMDIEAERNETETQASPENVLMQWFVPNEPEETSQSAVPEKNLSVEKEGHIMVTFRQQNADGESKVVQQQILVGKGVETSKIVKKDNVSEKVDCCRLCMSKEQVSVNVLDNVKDNIMVMEAVQLCLHPLEISLEDPFSKKICFRCFNLLQKYFEFRQSCLKFDAEQKKAYEKAHPMHRFLEKRRPTQQFTPYQKRTHMKTIISPTKRGYHQTEVMTTRDNYKGSVSKKVILTPTMKRSQSDEISYLLKGANSESGPNEKCVRQIISKVSRSDDIQVYKLKKDTSSISNGQTTSHPARYSAVHKTTPSIPITLSPTKLRQSDIEALARKPPLPTAKQLKIQEELKKVIEGTMSKDDLSVDHVIVRVVSDDESEDVVEHFPTKRKKFTHVPITGEPGKMKIGRSEVIIPKGIRVTVPQRFESSKGVFPCFPKMGPCGTEFTLIDGYLFEHRLCKGKERFLKCVSCSSLAFQKMLPTGKFENRAVVKTTHNHPQLKGNEVKKQMFSYVMKKKIQIDKSLNFRILYDKICEKDPEIRQLVPLTNLINEICKHQLNHKTPTVKSFEEFYNLIENDSMQKYQFTCSGRQFYQERFAVPEEGSKAVIFANKDTIKKVSHSKLMYVDASFRIDTGESFSYQLVTVLVWVDDSYYPIMFALVSDIKMEIFKKVFSYLHDTLAPNLCPEEIVTDYEANIYYALGETYLDSHIGGSVFYYTQNLYKKICELGLSRELEAISYFRNIYHMLLMLPLLPVNTIVDGLQNIEIQANDLGVGDAITALFEHIREQWIEKVTPDLFCVHRLENRINENVIAPFKKLRDFLMLSKGKTQRQTLNIVNVVEKLIDLENFLQTTYSSENKKSFGRDLSSSQKKNVLKAWQYIETHPKININHFFSKVIGYIKCMENQLWIWGYYKFLGKVTDDLINAANFSIVNTNEAEVETNDNEEVVVPDVNVKMEDSENTVVVEAVVGPSGEFVISNPEENQEVDKTLFKYVYKNS